MQPRILDAEFAHLAAAGFRAVDFFGQAVVFFDHAPLLEQAGGVGQRQAVGQARTWLENPRIADRAAGDGDAVDAGLAEHVEAGLRREQIAAAQDRARCRRAVSLRARNPNELGPM